jgi:chromosome segregation ATPase
MAGRASSAKLVSRLIEYSPAIDLAHFFYQHSRSLLVAPHFSTLYYLLLVVISAPYSTIPSLSPFHPTPTTPHRKALIIINMPPRTPSPLSPSRTLYPDEVPSPDWDKRSENFKKARGPGDSTIWNHNDGTAQWEKFQRSIDFDLGAALARMSDAKRNLDDTWANSDDAKAVSEQLKLSRELLEKSDDAYKLRETNEYLQQLTEEYEELERANPGTHCAQIYRENAVEARKKTVDLLYKFIGKVKSKYVISLESYLDEAKAEITRLVEQKLASDEMLQQAANQAKIAPESDEDEPTSAWVESFQNALAEVREEARDLHQQVKNLTRDLAVEKVEHQHTQSKLDAASNDPSTGLLTKIEELQISNSEFKEGLIKELRDQLEKGSKDNELMAAQLKRVRKEHSGLISQNYEYKLEVATLKYSLQIDNSAAVAAREEAANANEAREKAEHISQSTLEQLTELTNKVASLEHEVEVAREEAAHSDTAREMAERTNQSTSQQLTDLTNTHAQVGESLRGTRTALDAAHEKLAATRENAAMLQATIDEMQTAGIGMQATIDKSNITIKDSEARIHRMQTTIDESEATISTMRTTIEDMQTAGLEMQGTIDKSNKTIKEMQTTINEMQTTIDDLKKDIDEQQSTIVKHEATIGEMQTNIDDKQSTILNLQTAIEGKEKTISEMKETMAKKDADIVDLQGNVERLQLVVSGYDAYMEEE